MLLTPILAKNLNFGQILEFLAVTGSNFAQTPWKVIPSCKTVCGSTFEIARHAAVEAGDLKGRAVAEDSTGRATAGVATDAATEASTGPALGAMKNAAQQAMCAGHGAGNHFTNI